MVATVEMPQTCEEYRLRLIMEYNRLLAWGKIAGLIETEEKAEIAIGLGADPLELAAILARIRALLEEFAELNGRYKELDPSKTPGKGELEEKARKDPTSVNLQQEVSNLALQYEKTKEKRQHMLGTNHLIKAFKGVEQVARHPITRIRWTAVDKDSFQSLIEQLRVLTTRLHQLMGDYRLKKIKETTAQTYMEMVQMRGSIEDLKRIVVAVSLLPGNNTSGHEADHRSDQVLEELARMKQLNTSAQAVQSIGEFSAVKLSASKDIKIRAGEATRTWSRAIFMKAGQPEKFVWIEWKSYSLEIQPEDPSGGPKIHPNIIKRTAELAALLTSPKPNDFCAPHCLGFFDHGEISDEQRFGWVFEMPKGATEKTEPKSLLWMFTNISKPSLTERAALASKLAASLLFLHSVNWIHKALRSENVLFLFTDDQYDMEKPILSGFEYSRPDGGNNTSEWSNPKPEWDMYRWPSIQRAAPKERHSRKTYDIYSLGLILLEICHWQPLYQLMSIGDPSKLTLTNSKQIRARLLNEPDFMRTVLEMVGKKYHEAVLQCIRGHEGFDIQEADEQSTPDIGIKLQLSYTKSVVQPLRTIDV